MLDAICVKGFKDKFLKAFISTPGGKEHYPNKYVEGMKKGVWDSFVWGDRPLVIQGILRGCEDFIWECQKRNHPYYYLDHAYFHATRDYREGEFGVLYRVNYSEMNTSTILELSTEDYARIQKYKPIPQNPRQPNTEHILVFPPTKASARIYNVREDWNSFIERKIRKYTDREIIFRKKGTKTPLRDQLKNCHAVVSINSTAAVEAVLAGVPSFTTEYSPAGAVSNKAFQNIETPWFPDKDLITRWVDSLLATQFTFEEIKNGTAYEAVTRLYGAQQ